MTACSSQVRGGGGRLGGVQLAALGGPNGAAPEAEARLQNSHPGPIERVGEHEGDPPALAERSVGPVGSVGPHGSGVGPALGGSGGPAPRVAQAHCQVPETPGSREKREKLLELDGCTVGRMVLGSFFTLADPSDGLGAVGRQRHGGTPDAGQSKCFPPLPGRPIAFGCSVRVVGPPEAPHGVRTALLECGRLGHPDPKLSRSGADSEGG